MKISKKTINEAASKHALEVMGAEQFKKNKNAIKSIKLDFIAGIDWLQNKLSINS